MKREVNLIDSMYFFAGVLHSVKGKLELIKELCQGKIRVHATFVAKPWSGVHPFHRSHMVVVRRLIELYATGNGHPCQVPADFDWFGYRIE